MISRPAIVLTTLALMAISVALALVVAVVQAVFWTLVGCGGLMEVLARQVADIRHRLARRRPAAGHVATVRPVPR